MEVTAKASKKRKHIGLVQPALLHCCISKCLFDINLCDKIYSRPYQDVNDKLSENIEISVPSIMISHCYQHNRSEDITTFNPCKRLCFFIKSI